MPRLNVVEPDEATGPVKEIYADLTSKMGQVVNIFKGIGNSPAALKAYLSMSTALSEGELSVEDREVVYLAVSALTWWFADRQINKFSKAWG